MWNNLARGLKENLDVGAIRETIHHVADVVAPQLSDEEYETDEEEYEYYEEEIVEEEEPQENKGSLGSMLQHMLDDEEVEHHRMELKEQEERYVRPTIPDDDDDDEIVEEVISFEPESRVNANDRKAASPVPPPPPPPVEPNDSSPAIATEPHHFPGVPVPHTYKAGNELEPLPVKKERILSTEPVRLQSEISDNQEKPQVSSIRPTEPKPAHEPPITSTESTLNDSTATGGAERKGVSISETMPTRNERLMNGREMSKSPPVQPVPKPPVVPVKPRAVPSATHEINMRTAPSPPPPEPFQKQSPTELPPPAPPRTKSPPVPAETNKEPAVTKAKLRSTPSPPVPSQKVSPPAPVISQQEKAKVRPVSPQVSMKQQTSSPPAPRNGPEIAVQEKKEEEVSVESMPHTKRDTQELPKKANQVVSSKKKDAAENSEMLKMQRRCQDLEKQLQHAEMHIVELQRDAAQRMDEEEEWRESHLRQFQEEQARIVEAATEAASQEHERDLAEMRNLLQQECFALKEQLQDEQMKSERQAEHFQRVLKEAEARAEAAEKEKRRAESKQNSSMSQLQQQQEHAVRMAEDKLVHTLAKLDDREEEVAKLKTVIKELKASTTEHREVAQEAEEEMDELHAENEALQHNLHAVTAERDELNKQLKLFSSQKEKMNGLQMELRMLKEARDRERAHRENAAVYAESNQAELVAERDVALATVRDLERQLTAALADLDIAKSDADRIMMGSVNLQSALEAFQSERDAEMQMVQEQRVEAEAATAAAHSAAIEATREANETRMREVQMAADAAVKNVMTEVNELEAKLEESRKENGNLRHSLDEAIRRLQTSQEDVIDRVLMKNILLDWFSQTGKNKRDVLALMASVLHFTEEEKDAIHIGDHHGGTLGKVVGAVAAPFPPSAADIEHLEGDTVREKWVNFLLAEAGDDDASGVGQMANEPPAMNGDVR